ANGDIVGSQYVAPRITHAYRYNRATGQIDDIPPVPGGTSNMGMAINDLGDVVGQSDAGNGIQRAFVAHPGLASKALPSVAGAAVSNDEACGINNSGQVAGSSTLTMVTGLPEAARFEADGVTVVDAGHFDQTFGYSTACAIDADGTIGGFTTVDTFSSNHAYR